VLKKEAEFSSRTKLKNIHGRRRKDGEERKKEEERWREKERSNQENLVVSCETLWLV